MADYHPIDVRYTGPSTSYRGSAELRVVDQKRDGVASLPKLKRKSRSRSTNTLTQSANIPAKLLFWVFRKWGGILTLLVLYVTLGGFDMIKLLLLFGGL